MSRRRDFLEASEKESVVEALVVYSSVENRTYLNDPFVDRQQPRKGI